MLIKTKICNENNKQKKSHIIFLRMEYIFIRRNGMCIYQDSPVEHLNLTQFWELLRPPSQSDCSIDLDMTCRLKNVSPLLGKIWAMFPFRDFENFVHLGLASGE